jgi:hypothetical protein
MAAAANQLEKVACGAFSDSGFAAAIKRRDFCWLSRVGSSGMQV